MMTKLLIPALGIALLVAGCAGLGSGRPLTTAELNREFGGATLKGTTSDGTGWTGTFASYGTVVAEFDSGGGDLGTWRAADDQLCTQWNSMSDGMEKCFTVRRSGSGVEFIGADGTVNGTGTLSR